MTTQMTPREIDTALAAAWHEIDKAWEHRGLVANSVFRWAEEERGIRSRYIRKGYVPSLPISEARAELDKLVTAGDERSIMRGKRPSEALAKLDEADARVQAARAVAEELERHYTGWSRFFVVTSSAGHVHASRNCRTTRSSTTFGWLPQLSGKSEAEAVQELGERLCSVCFPSAPIAWQGGTFTRAQAGKLAA